MPERASAQTWVEVHRLVLAPGERAPQTPDDTRQTPLELKVKGFLTHDAAIGEEVDIITPAGRTLSGTLIAINPAYTHTFLPPQVQQQVLDVVRLDMHDSQADILQTARDVIAQHEREEEQDLVHRLLHRAGHGGLAAVGMPETLEAANAGRIHLLIMHRDLTYPGWHCPGCGHLEAEPHLTAFDSIGVFLRYY